jgi:hypothetical protein
MWSCQLLARMHGGLVLCESPDGLASCVDKRGPVMCFGFDACADVVMTNLADQLTQLQPVRCGVWHLIAHARGLPGTFGGAQLHPTLCRRSIARVHMRRWVGAAGQGCCRPQRCVMRRLGQLLSLLPAAGPCVCVWCVCVCVWCVCVCVCVCGACACVCIVCALPLPGGRGVAAVRLGRGRRQAQAQPCVSSALLPCRLVPAGAGWPAGGLGTRPARPVEPLACLGPC